MGFIEKFKKEKKNKKITTGVVQTASIRVTQAICFLYNSVKTVKSPQTICIEKDIFKLHSAVPFSWWCSGSAKSGREPVIEQLVGRQGEPRVAQVHAMLLKDWKGWIQDSPLPRPYSRVDSGGKGISGDPCLPFQGFLRVSRFFFSLFLCPQLLHWAYPHLQHPMNLLLFYHCCAFHCIVELQMGFKAGKKNKNSTSRI